MRAKRAKKFQIDGKLTDLQKNDGLKKQIRQNPSKCSPIFDFFCQKSLTEVVGLAKKLTDGLSKTPFWLSDAVDGLTKKN